MDTAGKTLFSKRLKKFREQKKWSRDKLAYKTQELDEQKTGLTSRTICNYEKGESHPSAKNLELLSKALEVSIFELSPLFCLGDLDNLLEERMDTEIELIDKFIEKATSKDFEILKNLLKAYELSTGSLKLNIDMMIHKTIISVSKESNVLASVYFLVIDELVLNNHFYDEPEHDRILTEIHIDLVNACLNKDREEMIRIYEQHREFNLEQIHRNYEDDWQ